MKYRRSSRSGRLGLYFCTVERKSKQNALLPRKILSSVTAFACSAEIKNCRGFFLFLFTFIAIFICAVLFNLSVPPYKPFYRRGTPWQVCRQTVRFNLYWKVYFYGADRGAFRKSRQSGKRMSERLERKNFIICNLYFCKYRAFNTQITLLLKHTCLNKNP